MFVCMCIFIIVIGSLIVNRCKKLIQVTTPNAGALQVAPFEFRKVRIRLRGLLELLPRWVFRPRINWQDLKTDRLVRVCLVFDETHAEDFCPLGEYLVFLRIYYIYFLLYEVPCSRLSRCRRDLRSAESQTCSGHA